MDLDLDIARQQWVKGAPKVAVKRFGEGGRKIQEAEGREEKRRTEDGRSWNELLRVGNIGDQMERAG